VVENMTGKAKWDSPLTPCKDMPLMSCSTFTFVALLVFFDRYLLPPSRLEFCFAVEYVLTVITSRSRSVADLHAVSGNESMQLNFYFMS